MDYDRSMDKVYDGEGNRLTVRVAPDPAPPDPLTAWQEIAALPMASPDTLELAQRIAEAQDGARP